MRRVFREYKVVLATSQMTMDIYRDMLEPLGFQQIEKTSEGPKVLGMAKKLKADLVVATVALPVFSGPQLLSAARADKQMEDIPFLIIGGKEEMKPGGLADNVNRIKLARFVGLPLKMEEFMEEVVDLLDPLVDPDKEKAYEYIDLAVEAVKAGDLLAALDNYEYALELYDTHLETWINKAAISVDIEAYDEAESSYLHALELDQYCMLAYLGLAELYERRGDYEQTIRILQQSIGIAQMLEASSSSVSRLNFFIGEFQLRLKRLGEADESFKSAVDISPDDAVLRADIGDAYSEKEYYAESEEHYLAAVNIDPNLAHIFNNLGIAYRKQKKYEKAISLYKRARFYHPKDENLLFNAARAHLESDLQLEAAALLNEALELSSKFRAAHYLLELIKSGKPSPQQTLEENPSSIWKRKPHE